MPPTGTVVEALLSHLPPPLLQSQDPHLLFHLLQETELFHQAPAHQSSHPTQASQHTQAQVLNQASHARVEIPSQATAQMLDVVLFQATRVRVTRFQPDGLVDTLLPTAQVLALPEPLVPLPSHHQFTLAQCPTTPTPSLAAFSLSVPPPLSPFSFERIFFSFKSIGAMMRSRG